MARAFGRLSSQFYKLVVLGHRSQFSQPTATYRLTAFKSTLASARQQEEPDPTPDSDDKPKRSVTNRVLDEYGHPYVDLSFNNAEEAYRSKGNFEIIRSLLVFNLCSINYLVDKNKEVFKFFVFFSFSISLKETFSFNLSIFFLHFFSDRNCLFSFFFFFSVLLNIKKKIKLNFNSYTDEYKVILLLEHLQWYIIFHTKLIKQWYTRPFLRNYFVTGGKVIKTYFFCFVVRKIIIYCVN